MNTKVTIAWLAAIVLPAVLGVSAEPRPLALVPQPLRVERMTGTFVLSKDTAILADKDSADAINVARQLAERLGRGTGFRLSASPADGNAPVHNAILLTQKKADRALGPEGYTLEATPEGVVITAADGPGLFYGAQTLLQLLPPQVFGAAKATDRRHGRAGTSMSTASVDMAPAVAWELPAVRIEDRPRFAWRGLLLDVARHFFSKAELKNFIDVMAQHKLNTLQLHLTDDVGWRLEIKRYPRLTQIGAWRKGIGFNLNPKDGTSYGPDGRYGGFYTQDDAREIVAYATARYITVVPEIEMPAHANAAMTAYPEFTCPNQPARTYSKFTCMDEPCWAYCAGNDATFEFIENVLAEVLDVFPSRRIHIGGDELGKGQWQQCPKCQARIRKEGLKNEDELQSYFVRRVEKYLGAHGRVLIGWDEILQGGLAPNATVMSWRGIEGGVAAANAGHDVVMTPTSHCYFDFRQAKTGEPPAAGGFLPLRTVYAFEPVPPSLSADKVKHILGAGGNLWGEYFPNYAHAQYMAYPRACAMAEVVWTDPKLKNWDEFKARLDAHLLRLKAQGVRYRQPRPADER